MRTTHRGRVLSLQGVPGTPDRYVGMMLVYAPSPHAGNPRYPWTKHGPHCYSEWWGESRRLPVGAATTATSSLPDRRRLPSDHAPMTIHGQHLDNRGWRLRTAESSLFYVGARANGAFSTPVFTMPRGPLVVNAELQFIPTERMVCSTRPT